MSLDNVSHALDRLMAAIDGLPKLDQQARLRVADEVLDHYLGNVLIQRIVNECAARLGVDQCLITVITLDSARILAAVVPTPDGRRTDSYCQFVTESGQPLVVQNNALRPTMLDLVPTYPEIGAYLGVPFIAHDQPLGAVCAINSQPREWTASDRRLLEAYSQQITAVLEEERI